MFNDIKGTRLKKEATNNEEWGGNSAVFPHVILLVFNSIN